MYHSGQALQGQPWESRGLGFGGHLAAPRSQDQEEVLNRVGGDGEKAILLRIEKKGNGESILPLSGVVTEQSVRKRRAGGEDLSSTDHCSLEMNQPQCEELWDLLAFLEIFCGKQATQ